MGGLGRVAGLFVALLILQVLSSGVNLLGANVQLTQALWGATMIVAVAARHLLSRWRGRARSPSVPMATSQSQPEPP
jgi:simple sugar transport system permease protein